MADEKQQEMKKFVRILLNDSDKMILVDDWDAVECSDGIVCVLGDEADDYHPRQIVPLHAVKMIHYDKAPIANFNTWKDSLEPERTAQVNGKVQAPELRKE